MSSRIVFLNLIFLLKVIKKNFLKEEVQASYVDRRVQ